MARYVNFLNYDSNYLPGCQYGDREDSCSVITNGAPCYLGDTDIQCCATCASYRTQISCKLSLSLSLSRLHTKVADYCDTFCTSPSACEYGDRKDCSALTYPADCYGSLSDGSAARNVCCQTCKNFETGIQGVSNFSECFVCLQFQFSLIILILLLFVFCYRLSVWRQGSGLPRH